jgi:hypothetical protein
LPSPGDVGPLPSAGGSHLSSESQSLRFAQKYDLYTRHQALLTTQPDLSQEQAAPLLGISAATLSRLLRAVANHGLDGLKDKYNHCGRPPSLTLTVEEENTLKSLYLRTNRTADSGSMQTACKFFALMPNDQPGAPREEVKTLILAALEKGRLPGFAIRACKRITREHFAALRQPKMLATRHFSGRRGTFFKDHEQRLRMIESDDGTLNFAAWIPWPQGGDPVSDKFGVRLGRWQFLPALDAGWTHYYLGYSLVARPRGSYTQDDIRGLISMVVHQFGLPDGFRFERGAWESNSITDLLEKLGINLTTVWQSNQKPFIEGGFNKLWTYLSLIDGQVGRFRGEMESNNLLVEKCRAGRADPRAHFPGLTQVTKAIDGALSMHNSDKIKSIYGEWIPEVRHRLQNEQRPWRQLPADLAYLFSPIVREWTVAKGTVGNIVTLADDLKLPFYFFEENLWKFNGQRVRVYFDPSERGLQAASPSVNPEAHESSCTATIVCLSQHAGYRPGEIICQASSFGEIPSFARAASGWADPSTHSREGQIPSPSLRARGPERGLQAASPSPSFRGPMAEVRREVRALAPQGRVKSSLSEELDGRGNRAAISKGARPSGRINEPTRIDETELIPMRGDQEPRIPISHRSYPSYSPAEPTAEETESIIW